MEKRKKRSMKRKIIKIIEEKCTGCRLCERSCAEGAIQVIDGKARVINEVFCDGLGACIAECPYGAIVLEERDAEPYDEIKTLKNILKHGKKAVVAHLKHLKEHGAEKYYRKAIDYIKKNKININIEQAQDHSIKKDKCLISGKNPSMLSNWPIQGHLVSPYSDYFKNSDLLVAADCCAFSYGDFQRDFIKGRAVFVGCPKLDSNTEVYVEKLATLIDNAKLKSIYVVTMEVPCCFGLVMIVEKALQRSKSRKKPRVIHSIISIKGDIIETKTYNV